MSWFHVASALVSPPVVALSVSIASSFPAGSTSLRVVLDIKGVPNPAPIIPLNLQGSPLLPWRKIFDLQVLQTHLRLYPSLEGGSKEDYPDSAQI